MKLIVGLGNPTKEYDNTRHNIGFMMVDNISKYYDFPEYKKFGKGLLASKIINNEKIFILKPQTWMNSSGDSISEVVGYYKIDTKDVIVLYDEMALPTGKVRIANKGSSAGHNGIKSILNYFDDFTRFRIGIDQPEHKTENGIKNYVLGKFTDTEIIVIKNCIKEDFYDMLLSGNKDKIMSENAILLKTIKLNL